VSKGSSAGNSLTSSFSFCSYTQSGTAFLGGGHDAKTCSFGRVFSGSSERKRERYSSYGSDPSFPRDRLSLITIIAGLALKTFRAFRHRSGRERGRGRGAASAGNGERFPPESVTLQGDSNAFCGLGHVRKFIQVASLCLLDQHEFRRHLNEDSYSLDLSQGGER
jgi:hypothetical protein